MMFSLSGELQQAQATLQKPPRRLGARHQPDDPDVYDATTYDSDHSSDRCDAIATARSR